MTPRVWRREVEKLLEALRMRFGARWEISFLAAKETIVAVRTSKKVFTIAIWLRPTGKTNLNQFYLVFKMLYRFNQSMR